MSSKKKKISNGVEDSFFEDTWTVMERDPDDDTYGLQVKKSKFRIKQKNNGDWVLDNKKVLDKWTPKNEVSLLDQGPWVNEATPKFIGLVNIDSKSHLLLVLGRPGKQFEVELRLKPLGISGSPDGSGRAGRG